MSRIAFLLLPLGAFLSACGFSPCGEMTIHDSQHFEEFIAELEKHGAKYKQISEKTVSYPCSSTEAFKKAEEVMSAKYWPGCGGRFSSPARQAEFIAKLEAEKIEHWIVQTDEGEQINCNKEDGERVSKIFQELLGVR